MLELGMDAFEQLYKIAKTEQVAEKSKFRIQAYQVLARLGMLNAALLRGATDEELLSNMIELEDENEHLEQTAKEIQARFNRSMIELKGFCFISDKQLKSDSNGL